MAKKVEVQKGPIRMDAQYASKFCREPEKTLRDMEHNFMRREKMTMDLHTPKK